jgi:hypothetical protein
MGVTQKKNTKSLIPIPSARRSIHVKGRCGFWWYARATVPILGTWQIGWGASLKPSIEVGYPQ